MTDNRTYTATRYDADSDVDAHQMTHFDPYAVIAQLQGELHAQRLLRREADQTAQWKLDEVKILRQQLAEAMTLVAELSAENERLRAELDAANRRADDAVAAYHVIAARMCGMGWWC